MTERGITPSQTVGPFFSFALTPGGDYSYAGLVSDDLVTEDTVGEPIVIVGRVLDGEGALVPDAMIEIWQADTAGRYAGAGPVANTTFKGFGRSDTKEGRYRFRTVRPGRVASSDGKSQAPHINVSIFARGVLRRMFTRIYFEDEPGNDDDPVLRLVPADRRSTLIARRSEVGRFVLDIKLQGEGETVFFEA